MARSVRSISAMDTSGWTVVGLCGDWAWPTVQQRKIPDTVTAAAVLAMVVQSRTASRSARRGGYDTLQPRQQQGIGMKTTCADILRRPVQTEFVSRDVGQRERARRNTEKREKIGAIPPQLPRIANGRTWHRHCPC
jgi:hypothetical protein